MKYAGDPTCTKGDIIFYVKVFFFKNSLKAMNIQGMLDIGTDKVYVIKVKSVDLRESISGMYVEHKFIYNC